MPDLRLIRADVLKLRRRRGMLAISSLLTVGSMLIAYTIAAIQHDSNPLKHGPAGGLGNYQNGIQFLTLMALVVGAIVGSTAGSQDLETGVFRDSVATGRSRLALFTSRVPAALAIVLPVVTVAAAVPAVASVTLNGSLPAPAAGALIAGTIGVLVAAALATTMAVGLSALVGSRGPVIATLLAFELAMVPLLVHASFLGDVRQVLPNPAIERIGHIPGVVHPALGVAIAAALSWAAIAFAAGAWKTRTSEI